MTARTTRLWILAATLLWLTGLALTPLTESTEGRYASVGAEMARSGDWLEPHFSGLPHYTKPPWAYWAVAASLSILPDQPWSARLPATAAGLFCMWLAAAIARSRRADDAQLARLRLLLLASPLFLAQARLPSGDIHLAAAILAVYWAALGTDRSTPLRMTAGSLGFAVGILAKGHIIFLWTLLPMLAWWLRRPRANLHALRIVASSLLIGALLALPWFLWARHVHPGLVEYWLGSETTERVMTNAHQRSEAWWYYLVLLPLTVLPWLPEAARALSRSMRERATSSLLLLGVILPTVVLQLSVSKRPNYLVPVVLLLALLTARFPVYRWWRRRCLVGLGLWLLLPILLAPVERLWPVTPQLAAAVPQDATTVVVHHELPSSLPFYLGRPVATLGVTRELRFANAAQRAEYCADDWQLAERLRPGDVVLSPVHKRAQITDALRDVSWTVRETIEGWELIEIEATP